MGYVLLFILFSFLYISGLHVLSSLQGCCSLEHENDGVVIFDFSFYIGVSVWYVCMYGGQDSFSSSCTNPATLATVRLY